MPRKPSTLIQRKQNPFLVDIVLKIYQPMDINIQPLVQDSGFIPQETPLLTINYLDKRQTVNCSWPAKVLAWGSNSFSKPGLHLLISLEECDHQPLTEQPLSPCGACNKEIQFYLDKQQIKITLLQGQEPTATPGSFVSRGDPLATMGDDQILAPARLRVIRVSSQQIIYRKVICRHQSIRADLVCSSCGQKVASIGKQFLIIGERGSFLSGRTALRRQHEYVSKLLSERKLILILDLDNTIIHTENLPRATDMSAVEEYINCPLDSELNFLAIKYRPYLELFLRTVLPRFDVYIYTAAIRPYAELVCQGILQLFKEAVQGYQYILSWARIMSRSDHDNKKKTLENVLPSKGENLTLILDDQPIAWVDTMCLVPTRPFFYLQYLEESKQLKCINRNDKFLADAANFLQAVHTRYFSQGELNDVRLIKKQILGRTLRGRRIHLQEGLDKEELTPIVQALGGEVTDNVEEANILIKSDLQSGKAIKREQKKIKSRRDTQRVQNRHWLKNLYYELRLEELSL